ncbi:MAG TPA: hypothetical protein IAC33_10290 [Candidatus Fimousia stercorigallinarum]|nr:hypothetical protein [Candidatus Fimousia stercorigallinarum]
MSSNTKVVVFKAKELLYTGIFLLLGIILILLLIFMFLPKDNEKEPAVSTETDAVYVPGVYTSSVQLGENTLDVQVTVDSQNIKSVNIEQLDDSVKTMYPLIEPSIASINEQLSKISSIDELTFEDESQYTNTILKQAIKNALKKAEP